jgi:diguanylate cyclase (GGDEF)-like protein
MLALFDLDGFKQYNDQFGHVAGDALLARLARKLEAQLKGRGTAYRMGGDEFCALIDPPNASEASVKAAASALSERGDGFDILCSFGAVTLPTEARTSSQALRTADHRMYAQKRGGRMLSLTQSKEAVIGVVDGAGDELAGTQMSMGDIAAAVALASGAVLQEADEIRQAAELHDIGKVAIPAAILGKPGRLTDIEWAFVRSHAIVGERILDAAPALTSVARLVRSSHERFDGNGYPDGLVGERIPLGARILAVCDAFHAMTSDRPYREAMTVAAALAELRRGAGTQFDPKVVAAFSQAIAARSSDVQRQALV